MLSSLLKEHQQRQHAQKKIQEERRARAVAASKQLTSALVDQLNSGVAEAYSQQRRVDAECRHLQEQASQLARHSDHWLRLLAQFSAALKQLGDVENWARCVHDDMTLVLHTLQQAHHVHQSSGDFSQQAPVHNTPHDHSQ